jgi:predicted phosphoribosyltransferase
MRHINRPTRETTIFADRADAGCRLAKRLRRRRFTNPLVLAIPRGGVVLGAVLADALGADLDVVLSRKLRMLGNSEFALGAIAETGAVYLNLDAEQITPALQAYLDRECRQQQGEIARRRELFRGGRPPIDVTGRSVLVVDDGIATGSTMLAALRALKVQHPREVIVAVPVASPDRLDQVRRECDEVVCLIEAPDLQAVGEFYRDFTQVEDEEVVTLLHRKPNRA